MAKFCQDRNEGLSFIADALMENFLEGSAPGMLWPTQKRRFVFDSCHMSLFSYTNVLT